MALNQDTNPTIKPYLRFGSKTPLQGYVPNQHRNDQFVQANALSADKFNEFERLLYNVCAYLGDISDGFEGLTIGSRVRYLNERLDNIGELTGGGTSQAGAFHNWLLGGNVFSDPSHVVGINTDEPRVNGFAISFQNYTATVQRGLGITGNVKNNVDFVETASNKTYELDSVGYTITGKNGGNPITPIDTSWSNWTNGESHAVGAAATSVQLNYRFVKTGYFTGLGASVVVVCDPGGGKQLFLDTSNFTLDKSTGLITNIPAAWKSHTIYVYYVTYNYQRYWVLLNNTTDEGGKILFRKGQSLPTLKDCINSNLYWNPDTSTYETLTINTGTQSLLYTIITYPWNNHIDVSYSESSKISYINNVFDLRIDPNTSNNKWRDIPSKVVAYPDRELMDFRSSDAYPDDYDAYRITTNATFNSYFGQTESTIALSPQYDPAPGLAVTADSNAKPIQSRLKYKLAFYAYTDEAAPVVVTASIRKGSVNIQQKQFTIDTSIQRHVWEIPSTAEDISNALLRLQCTLSAETKAVYICRISLIQVDYGVVTGDGASTAMALTCLPHSVIINGFMVATKSYTTTITKTNTYAAFVSNLNGEVSLIYGNSTTLPNVNYPDREAIIRLMYIGNSATQLILGKTLMIIPFSGLIHNDIFYARNTDEFLLGIQLMRDNYVAKVVGIGEISFDGIGNYTFPTHGSVEIIGVTDPIYFKINSKITIGGSLCFKMHNASFLAVGASAQVSIDAASYTNIDISFDADNIAQTIDPIITANTSNAANIQCNVSNINTTANAIHFLSMMCCNIRATVEDIVAASKLLYIEDSENCNLELRGHSNIIANTGLHVDGSNTGIECLALINTTSITTPYHADLIKYAYKGLALRINGRCIYPGITIRHGNDNNSNLSNYIHTETYFDIVGNPTGGAVILGDDNPDKDVQVIIPGDLTISGTTTLIHSVELVVEDKNIVLGIVPSGTTTDTTADGGGIILSGATEKKIYWEKTTEAWTSNQNIDLTNSGLAYMVEGVQRYGKDFTKIGDAVTTFSPVVSGDVSAPASGLVLAGDFKADRVWNAYWNDKPNEKITTESVAVLVGGAKTLTLTSNYDLANDTEGYTVILCNASLTLTLPDATLIKNRIFYIKNIGTGVVSIKSKSGSGQLIDNVDYSSTPLYLAARYDALAVVSDGTSWWII